MGFSSLIIPVKSNGMTKKKKAFFNGLKYYSNKNNSHDGFCLDIDYIIKVPEDNIEFEVEYDAIATKGENYSLTFTVRTKSLSPSHDPWIFSKIGIAWGWDEIDFHDYIGREDSEVKWSYILEDPELSISAGKSQTITIVLPGNSEWDRTLVDGEETSFVIRWLSNGFDCAIACTEIECVVNDQISDYLILVVVISSSCIVAIVIILFIKKYREPKVKVKIYPKSSDDKKEMRKKIKKEKLIAHKILTDDFTKDDIEKGREGQHEND